MRSRNIKPGFFKNEELADCDPLSRLLFAGLWCLADKEGILEDRLRKIKVELLPYDNCNIGKLLSQLEDKKFITRYTVNSNNYILINKFKEHQSFNIKEKESTFPTPCLNGVQLVQNNSDTNQERLKPEALSLKPEIPIQKKNSEKDFDIFWNKYPNKVDKKYSLKCWLKARELPNIEIILTAIQKQKEWRDNSGGEFRPAWKNPATWINNGSWSDEANYGGNNGNRQTFNTFKRNYRAAWELSQEVSDAADEINRKYYAAKAAAAGKPKENS